MGPLLLTTALANPNGCACAADQELSAASPPPTLAEPDLLALLRVGQLAQWLLDDVPLELGLCIQARYRMHWPADKGPATDREEEALQQARESCARDTQAPAAASKTALRLVAEARDEFKQRMARLHGPFLAMNQCLKALPPAGAGVEQCLNRIAGRPLTSSELAWLFSSGAVHKPSKLQ